MKARTYWNQIAENYEDEIFSVKKHDRQGLVMNRLDRYSCPDKKASDLGCGIGNFLPALSFRFKHIHAIDISLKCIKRAQSRFKDITNISYRIADLSKKRARLPMVDLALSVNSILTTSLTKRNRMFDLACRHIRPGGHHVLVVPSLESAFLADHRLIEWNLKSGMSPGNAVRSGFRTYKRRDVSRLRQGIVRIDNVGTKHYLKEELIIILESRGMKVLEIEKIQYSWETEFDQPPRWMKEPFPWDWLCVAEKVHKQ